VEAIINKEGQLCVLRNGTLKIQSCKVSGNSICNDSCPLFFEPDTRKGEKKKVSLNCAGYFVTEYTILRDDRGVFEMPEEDKNTEEGEDHTPMDQMIDYMVEKGKVKVELEVLTREEAVEIANWAAGNSAPIEAAFTHISWEE